MEVAENFTFDQPIVKKGNEEDTIDIPHNVRQLISSLIKKEGYTTFIVSARLLNTEGRNYTGAIYEIDIKGQNGENDLETNVVIKRMVSSNLLDMFDLKAAYSQERFAYLKLFKIFESLQDEMNIPKEKRFKTVKCYEESHTDALMFESLTKRNYTTFKLPTVVGYDFAMLAMQELAYFHGLSFALQKQKPDVFKTHIETIRRPQVFGKSFLDTLKVLVDSFIHLFGGNIESKIRTCLRTLQTKVPKYLTEDTFSTTCLCHGDFGANNLMFKEKEGIVTEVIAIDYQLLFYGSPVIDIIFFIFTGTDRQFRKKYMTDLKDHYYYSLKNYLSYYNIDIDSVYPKNKFEKDFLERLDFGLMVSLILLPIYFATDTVKEIHEKYLSTIKVNEMFYNRMSGVVDDYIEWGIL